jgi:hypothetical protein
VPDGFRPIPFDCLLKTKRNGTKKIRGIVKGYFMAAGIDFNETFAPVPVITTIRILFAIAAMLDWDIKQGDVNTAFLSADMDSEVYVSVPRWFSLIVANHKKTGFSFHRLLKGVPGIPQGPRLFNKKSHVIYTQQGLTQSKSDFSLYYCNTRMLYLVVWVDDLFLCFPKESRAHGIQLWSALQQELDLDDWQDVDDCLGCKVTRDRLNRKLSLSQQAPIEKLLVRSGMMNCSKEHTPMAAGLSLSKTDCPKPSEAITMADKQREFRSFIATFIYFANWSRPDLSNTVSKICKFMHNPGEAHFTALKRALRYLSTTRDWGLLYDFSPAALSQVKVKKAYGYYDASHADCPDTRRSTLAYVFFLFGCPVSWHCKSHTYITTSTNHSEYCAAAKAAREAKWQEKIYTDIGFEKFVRPITLFSDSKGAIAMTYNPVQRAASKHVDLADHYAREQQERGTINIVWINSHDMIADLLTKALGRPAFTRHASALVTRIIQSFL